MTRLDSLVLCDPVGQFSSVRPGCIVLFCVTWLDSLVLCDLVGQFSSVRPGCIVLFCVTWLDSLVLCDLPMVLVRMIPTSVQWRQHIPHVPRWHISYRFRPWNRFECTPRIPGDM